MQNAWCNGFHIDKLAAAPATGITTITTLLTNELSPPPTGEIISSPRLGSGSYQRWKVRPQGNIWRAGQVSPINQTIHFVTHANTKKMRWKWQQVSHEILNWSTYADLPLAMRCCAGCRILKSGRKSQGLLLQSFKWTVPKSYLCSCRECFLDF